MKNHSRKYLHYQQAEQALDRLGILISNAVGMFLRQIVLQRGISFEMKLLAYEEEPWHSRRRFGKLKQNMELKQEHLSEFNLRGAFFYIFL